MPTAYRDDPDAPLDGPAQTENENQIDVESQERDINIQNSNGRSEGNLHNPAWLQNGKNTKLQWVPSPIRKAGRAIVNWVKGPVPPRELKIVPKFPSIQEAPIKLMDRYVPKTRHRAFLLVVVLAIWFLIWSLILKQLSGAGYIEGYGKPQKIWCGYSMWRANNGCGINGDECRPFAGSDLVFKCPANCPIIHLGEQYVVGNETHEFTGLVIGGPSASSSKAIYRGDSWVCQAAIHAGIVSSATGGCGVATLIGEHTGFEATKRNGMQSFKFPSTFPKSYYFPDPSTYNANCPPDNRWGILVVTVVALIFISVFTTSPAAFYFSTFFVMMFHIGLVGDPPNKPNFYELLSTFASVLLPASFIAVVLYKFCARPLLTGLTAQIEKTVLYLGFCFIGALNSFTFAYLIPIQRLTPNDLAQPGAPFALTVVLTTIIVIVIGQIHFIRVSGNMPRYLIVYGTIAVVLIVLLLLPNQRLRIHHYILGIIFMPGTFTKNRASLAYQGLLLGLFINGVCRWGFASIIQTPSALGEAGGSAGKSWWGSTPPKIHATIPPNAANITFTWGQLPKGTGIDGLSILVNDVERWRGYADTDLYWDPTQVTLERQHNWKHEPVPEFYRFAWMKAGAVGLYSNAAVWDENNVWHPAQGNKAV